MLEILTEEEYRDKVVGRDFNFEGVTLTKDVNDTLSSDETVDI